jgi:hypothetical protein
LGWWHSQYMEKCKIPWFQTTNQLSKTRPLKHMYTYVSNHGFWGSPISRKQQPLVPSDSGWKTNAALPATSSTGSALPFRIRWITGHWKGPKGARYGCVLSCLKIMRPKRRSCQTMSKD